MRGVGRSTGRASLTGVAEVNDVVSVCNWASSSLSLPWILLVGSFADAPMGSAVDKIEQAIGYVSIGYPLGLTTSILFGRHHKVVLQSPKPKLFIMGARDGFTSVKQLKSKLSSASGRVETHLIEGAGHFQMEGPWIIIIKRQLSCYLPLSRPSALILLAPDKNHSAKSQRKSLVHIQNSWHWKLA